MSVLSESISLLLYAYKYIHTRCRFHFPTHDLLLQPSLNHSNSTSFYVSVLSESIPLLLYAYKYIHTRYKFHFPTHAFLLQPSLLHSYYTSFYVSLLSESIPLLLYAYKYIRTLCIFHFPNRAKHSYLVLVVHLLQDIPHLYTDANDTYHYSTKQSQTNAHEILHYLIMHRCHFQYSYYSIVQYFQDK